MIQKLRMEYIKSVDNEYGKYLRPMSMDDVEVSLNNIYYGNKSDEFIKLFSETLFRGYKSNQIVFLKSDAEYFSGLLKYVFSLIISIGTLGLSRKFVKNLHDYLEDEINTYCVLGFWSFETNKLHVIFNDRYLKPVDNGIYINPHTLYITMHEMCHYFSGNYPVAYKGLFESTLFKFYTLFYKKNLLIKPEESLKISTEYLNKFINVESKLLALSGEAMDKYYFNNLKEFSDDIISIAGNSVNDRYVRNMNAVLTGNPYTVYSDIKYTYEKMGYGNFAIRSMYYQEVLFPSEVICIISEIDMDTPLYKTMLKRMFT